MAGEENNQATTTQATAQTGAQATSVTTVVPTIQAGATAAPAAAETVPQPQATATQLRAVDTDNSQKNIAEINREFQEKSAERNAKDLGIKYIDIAKTPINPDFLKVLDMASAMKARIIPFFKQGKILRIATDDIGRPETKEILDALKKNGYELDFNLASTAGIDEAMKIYMDTQQYKKMDIVETVEQKALKTYDKEIEDLSKLSEKLDNIPAEEGMNVLNIGAMKTGASDAHYEPEENATVVRFRIDGMLHKVFEVKKGTYKNILNQIKFKSGMQLNVANVPQDGRYDFNYNGRRIDVRVSAIPTPQGESLVCRYLVAGKESLTFADLGFQDLALKQLEKASKISQGMILVTGPTGSGKTTTLYSVLSTMKTSENKVITLEDPVEYHIQGVTQSQIDEKRGYNFASGLRSVLRQDPNIVMIGEIRDLETAETAAQAALTGHVLLSTLHTNSAIESIPRLINIGLPPYMVAPSLDTIVAQRLVRKVCPKCVTFEPITESAKKEFETVLGSLEKLHHSIEGKIPDKLPKIHGCPACSNTGYQGRLVIAEVIVIDKEMKDLILNKASTVKMIEAARLDGLVTMREDGLIKVTRGLTTLEEVHRVTNISL